MLRLQLASETFADPEIDHGIKPPAGHSGPVPPGLAFAAWLQEELRPRLDDVQSGEFSWVTYTGHGMELQTNARRFDLVVELIDREATTWMLTLEPRRGLLPFGRKKRSAGFEQLSRRLTDALMAAEEIDAVEVLP